MKRERKMDEWANMQKPVSYRDAISGASTRIGTPSGRRGPMHFKAVPDSFDSPIRWFDSSIFCHFVMYAR